MFGLFEESAKTGTEFVNLNTIGFEAMIESQRMDYSILEAMYTSDAHELRIKNSSSYTESDLSSYQAAVHEAVGEKIKGFFAGIWTKIKKMFAALKNWVSERLAKVGKFFSKAKSGASKGVKIKTLKDYSKVLNELNKLNDKISNTDFATKYGDNAAQFLGFDASSANDIKEHFFKGGLDKNVVEKDSKGVKEYVSDGGKNYSASIQKQIDSADKNVDKYKKEVDSHLAGISTQQDRIKNSKAGTDENIEANDMKKTYLGLRAVAHAHLIVFTAYADILRYEFNLIQANITKCAAAAAKELDKETEKFNNEATIMVEAVLHDSDRDAAHVAV